MRTFIASIAFLFSLSASASALNYENGTLRIKNAATKNRSIWARNKTLIIVLPPNELEAKRYNLNADALRSVRVVKRQNRTDIEIRLNTRAETLLGTLEMKEDKKDLVIVIDPKAKAQADKKDAAMQAAILKKAKELMKAQENNAKAPIAAKTINSESQKTPAASPSKKDSKSSNWLNNSSKKEKQTWADKERPIQKRSSLWLFAGCLLVGGIAFFYMKRKKKGGMSVQGQINLLGMRSLGAKQKLMLVEVEGERILLASTDKDIHMLHALTSSSKNENNDLLVDMSEPSLKDFFKPQSDPKRGRVVDQINKRIDMAKEKQTAEEMPLDEAWAEGIRRLRRSRQAQEPNMAQQPSRGHHVDHFIS